MIRGECHRKKLSSPARERIFLQMHGEKVHFFFSENELLARSFGVLDTRRGRKKKKIEVHRQLICEMTPGPHWASQYFATLTVNSGYVLPKRVPILAPK